MTPYLITIRGFRKWIDLSAIQMIHEPFIPIQRWPDDRILWREFPIASFSIQFAFRDANVEFKSESWNDKMTPVKVQEQIDTTCAAFNDLLAAWKAHGS